MAVSAVLEDLVLLLQPARANPARSKVNNVVFFIGGLSCAPTDPAHLDRFAAHRGSFCVFEITSRSETSVRFSLELQIVLPRNKQTKTCGGKFVMRVHLEWIRAMLSYIDSPTTRWKNFLFTSSDGQNQVLRCSREQV